MTNYKDNDLLFKEYQKTKDIKLRNQIALNNKNLIYPVINKYVHKTFNEYEEAEQEAFIILLKAVEDFNPDLGYKFSPYATKCLLKIMQMKAEYRKNKSLNEPVRDLKDENISLIDTLIDDSIDIEKQAECKFIIDRIQKILSKDDFDTIKLLYYDHFSLRKIGEMKEKSFQAIHKQKNRAIKIIFADKYINSYLNELNLIKNSPYFEF